MVSMKVSLFCFLIFMLTLISYTSCQGSTNGTKVATTTEKPEEDDTTESSDVKDESDSDSDSDSESESETETESESESDSDSENDDSEDDKEGEGTEKPETEGNPKKSEENSKKPEKPEKPEMKKNSEKKKEKKENEIDLEDDPIPKPRCLARYNNLNCTDAQRQKSINNYKATRGQLIQTLLQPINSSGLNNNNINNNNITLSTISPPSTNINSTSSSFSNTTASSSSSSSTTTTTTTSSIAAINLITSEISSCNRAIQLLASVDKYLRFNDSCEARVFGKRYNPDYWISRCMKSLRRHQ